MDESGDDMNSVDVKNNISPLAVKTKPKKRSLVERELETNLTARVTSPVSNGDGASTSRYGRSRRLKTETEYCDSRKIMLEVLKTSQQEKSPVKVQSPVYKMHASNSPIRTESPIKAPIETYLENQIDNIYQENISLSRFSVDEEIKPSSEKKCSKVYIRKDLLQKRDPEETIILIKNMFSPVKSTHRASNSHLSNVLERSSEKYNVNSIQNVQNGYIDNSSVVKTLDFDSKKKKKENKETKLLSKSILFDLEANCLYQVGDLAWARMGTYPFWPCIVTRDPSFGIFVKKKLFGRIEHDIIHVTFFGDNGRRGWIVDNMLRRFLGLKEFETTREKFTPEDKKKDSKLYAAFFVSEKKLSLWKTSVEEAESLLREPKRLRIDLLNDMLVRTRELKTTPKCQKSGKITRTDSDVSLSESLYDTLFSEDDGKPDDTDRLRNKTRNKSLDVSDVVTACLDNMAAKTGIIKIQRQSHMDRWLQKAKSKTPEKPQTKALVPIKLVDNKTVSVTNKRKKLSPKDFVTKPYSLRKSTYESQNLLAHQNEHDYSKLVPDYEKTSPKTVENREAIERKYEYIPLEESGSGIGVITKVVSLADKAGNNNKQTDEISTSCIDDFTVTEKSKEIIIAQEVDDLTSFINGEKLNAHCNENHEMEVNVNIHAMESNENTKKNINQETLIPNQQIIFLENSEINNTTEHEIHTQSNSQVCQSGMTVSDKDSTLGEEIISQDKSNDHYYENKHVINNEDTKTENLKKNMIIKNKRSNKFESCDAATDTEHQYVDHNHITNETYKHHPDLPVQSDNYNNINVESSPICEKGFDLDQNISSVSEKLIRDYKTNGLIEIKVSNNNDFEKTPFVIDKDVLEGESSLDEENHTKNELAPIQNYDVLEKSTKMLTYINENSEQQELIPVIETEVEKFGTELVQKNITNFSNTIVDLDSNIIEENETQKHNIKETKSSDKIKIKVLHTDSLMGADHINNTIDDDFNNVITLLPNKINSSDKSEIVKPSIKRSKSTDSSLNADIAIKTTDKNFKSEVSQNNQPNYVVESNTNKAIVRHHNNIDSSVRITGLGDNLVSSDLNNYDECLSVIKEDFLKSADSCKEVDYVLESIENNLVTDFNSENDGNKNQGYQKKTDAIPESSDSCIKSDILTESNIEPIANTNGYHLNNNDKHQTFATEEHRENFKVCMKLDNIKNIIQNTFETEIISKENVDHPSSHYECQDTKTIERSSINTNSCVNTDDPMIATKINFETLTTFPTYEEKSESDKQTTRNTDKIEANEIITVDKKPESIPNICEPIKENGFNEMSTPVTDDDYDMDNGSINSEDSEISIIKIKRKLRSIKEKNMNKTLKDPDFLKYLEIRQDAVMDEHPELNQDELINYLYKTWVYEEGKKSDWKKSDDLQHSNLVKGLDEPYRKKTSNRSLKLNKRKKDTFSKTGKEFDSLSMTSESSGISTSSSDISTKIPFVLLQQHKPSNQNFKHIAESSKLVNVPVINNDDKKIETRQIDKLNNLTDFDTTPIKDVDNGISKKSLRAGITTTMNSSCQPMKVGDDCGINTVEKAIDIEEPKSKSNILIIKEELDTETASIDSEASDVPLIYRKLRLRNKENVYSPEGKIKSEIEADNASINSEDSDLSLAKRKQNSKYVDKKTNEENNLEDPEFIKYLELRQDAIIDENPQLTQTEISNYLYKTWLYEEDAKSDLKKTDEIEQSGLVKGLSQQSAPPKKVKKKVKVEKEITDYFSVVPKDKPKRKTGQPYYNEDYSDIEDEIGNFEIFKSEDDVIKTPHNQQNAGQSIENLDTQIEEIEDGFDEIELYFSELTKPKPNIFKGLVREKVCDICEKTENLVKCKACHGMFHIDCIQKKIEVVEAPVPSRGRKKKKKAGRRPKSLEDSESQSDEKQDVSEDQNVSIEELIEQENRAVDAETFEAQLTVKMKELLDNTESINYDSYSSDDGIDWTNTIAGKCEIIDVKLKRRSAIIEMDYSDFKCNNCQEHDTPICFVCKSAISKKESKLRQRCHVAHCNKYYHLECLDHWPQTQFNSGEPSRNNKKINEFFEALACPRHVCHTCVSDDPRGCKTRFSGDKLARCVRCPATYHSFTKCLPAGTQILTGSHIICPRHYEHRPGKVPCHVNTGWCFICALGGSLICCEYCPTSFHAECLNIDPPEGGYMCEDCETGRLPLYGEMVWVKLGHYRWWPGIVLHPCEIPENIMAVKHTQGEFVVRFFGQYDHYWVNRGRVFPFQEGDSGRISSQKSKIDAAFTTAMEHAQRACEILKSAQQNEEESLDIASSLLPPHYVKLKVNRPCGALCARRPDDPELSLTQCECAPGDHDPCGPYSQCLNRMLLTECGPTCRAGERCNNRAFEKRLYPKLVPYRTPHRGWGLKTLEEIKAGQFVIEYVGELIDEEEFKRRMRRKHEIRDENFYFLTLDKERMIDAGPKGNLARFMNHCCEPNCETQKWTVLGDVRVGLFALHDIPANSEVTFNYNLECAGIEKKRCLCGARRCSGYIGAKPKQDESQSKKPKIAAKRTYKKRKMDESPSTSKNKPKRPIGRPPKPKELSEIEKDLLIIRNATNGLSSDESSRSLSLEGDRNPKALKRKRVSFSSEEIVLFDSMESPSSKRPKMDEKEVGD